MFQDRARIVARAGRGGDGALSFRREKHVPRGGPDGGDGGRGGDVVLLADPDLRDLGAFRSRKQYDARPRRLGRRLRKAWRDGDDVVLHVPVGTQVLDAEGNRPRTSLTPGRASSSRRAGPAATATAASRPPPARCRGSRRPGCRATRRSSSCT